MPEVPAVYVVSTSQLSGKTALCLGLSVKFKSLGLKVGYFKPIGTRAEEKPEDDDAILMKQVLGLNEPLETICPLRLRRNFLEEYSKIGMAKVREKIFSAYQEACRGKDVMLVEGPGNPSVGSFAKIPPSALALELQVPIVLVSRVESDADVDRILYQKLCIGESGASLLGVVLTQVKRQIIERVKAFFGLLLSNAGIDLLGITPEVLALTAPTVRDVYEHMGGEFLANMNKLENMIEDVYVGSMTLESGLRYFRRSANKAVILGGDRTDLAIAALDTGASLLVLTGGIYPDIQVLNKAEMTGTPILMVPHDTFTTVREFEKVSGHIKPQNKKKIEIAEKLVDENVRWKEILEMATRHHSQQ